MKKQINPIQLSDDLLDIRCAIEQINFIQNAMFDQSTSDEFCSGAALLSTPIDNIMDILRKLDKQLKEIDDE
ncbi:MAG: hypothetical protein CSA86_01775 [Arcobacter sp.]|nr:MAG: hypothetical protein CSA86_01775 [Arcobacter sp.]